jgi:hypothetical protein
LFVEYENQTMTGGGRWHFVPAQGRLVGYDRRRRLPSGSYGPDGFAPAGEPPRDRFPGGLLYKTRLWEAFSTEFLAFPGGVYDVEFARHTVRPLFTPAAGETVIAADELEDPKRKQEELLLVRTEKAVHVLTKAGAPVVSLPTLFDREVYALFVGRLERPPRYFCWYAPGWCLVSAAEARSTPGYLVEYDAAGHEVARRVVPPRPAPEPSYAVALFGLATPPTEAATLVGTTGYLRRETRARPDQARCVLLDLLDEWTAYFIPGTGWNQGTRPGLDAAFTGLIGVSAVACAVVCFVLGRRHVFSRARLAGWSLCGLAFGPVGLLLLLALHGLPARVRCPGCGRPRVVDRDRCEHCGAAHAPPPPDGTEVFETAAAPAAPVFAGH